MSLQQQISLHMWIIELGVIQLVGDLLSQLECERKRACDKQRTLPAIYSGQTHHVAQADSEEGLRIVVSVGRMYEVESGMRNV